MQTKNERIRVGTLIFFSAEGEVFIRSAVAQNFPPVYAINESFQFVGAHSRGIKPANKSAHAGPGNVVDGDVVFVEPPQHTDVRQAHGAAAFQSHADFRAHAWRGILLRTRCAGPQKEQKNENNSAHADLRVVVKIVQFVNRLRVWRSVEIPASAKRGFRKL